MRFVFDDKEARIFSEQFKKKDSLLAQHTQRLLSRLVEGWVNKVRGNFSGWYRGPNRTGSTPSGKLRNRGKLKASVGGRVLGQKSLSTLRAVFRVGGKSAPYAEVQEEGKTISGKWMTIPVGKALTGAGRLKSAARIVKDGDGWGTAGMGRTFIRKGVIFSGTTKSGGKRRKPLALYILRRSVTIPPRLGAGHALDELQPAAMDEMQDRFIKVLSRMS